MRPVSSRARSAGEIRREINTMSVIPLLIILGLLVAGGFLFGFLWALRAGQFDDTTTPSWRILDTPPAPSHPAETPASKS